jgi:hypothetical protein
VRTYETRRKTVAADVDDLAISDGDSAGPAPSRIHGVNCGSPEYEVGRRVVRAGIFRPAATQKQEEPQPEGIHHRGTEGSLSHAAYDIALSAIQYRIFCMKTTTTTTWSMMIACAMP